MSFRLSQSAVDSNEWTEILASLVSNMSVKFAATTVMPKLTELPSELLESIFAHVETAQALTRLSLTCKGLHAFVEQQGYRIFVQSRFPSISVPPPASLCSNDGEAALHSARKFWKDAVHGLTTLSRNFDRRAFIAQAIRVPEANHNDRFRGSAHGHRRHGTSIGFMPVIDSYEAWYGGDWASRKEVVAWGAGAKLVVRSRIIGPRPQEDICGDLSNQEPQHHWQIYAKPGIHEGRDDITTLNLLPHNLGSVEELVLGRASGTLELIRLNTKSEDQTLTTYDTGGMPVRYTAVEHCRKSVAAACLGDQTVAIYRLLREGHQLEYCARTSIKQAHENARTWSTKFLREGRLAVGLGRSKQPLHLYDLGQDSPKLERAIHLGLDGEIDFPRLDVTGPDPLGTSIYSIAPLCPSSTSSGAQGDVFLSGAYDALVRYAFLCARAITSWYCCDMVRLES